MNKKLLFWVLIILFVSGAFYVVCPKYSFESNGFVRCNRFTGKVEIYQSNRWTTLANTFTTEELFGKK